MSKDQTTRWQDEFLADREEDHPWYGSCDGLATDGGCTECEMIRFIPGYAERKSAWWLSELERSRVVAERKARRKANRAAKREAIRQAVEIING